MVSLRFAWLVLLPLSLALGPSIAAQESPQTAPPASAQNPAPPAGAAGAAEFQVVIHADNPATELATAKVVKMFLKKLKRWDHGVRVMPIDLDAKSPIRKAFTKAVHGKSVTAINSFWQRMIFSGRDVPPPERGSEEAILEYVRTNPGAVGYVAAETPLGDGVKKLQVNP